MGNQKSTLIIGGRSQITTPMPLVSAITGNTVVEPFLSVVVVQPFVVYDPESVSTLRPNGIVVIVLVTGGTIPPGVGVGVGVITGPPAWGTEPEA